MDIRSYEVKPLNLTPKKTNLSLSSVVDQREGPSGPTLLSFWVKKEKKSHPVYICPPLLQSGRFLRGGGRCAQAISFPPLSNFNPTFFSLELQGRKNEGLVTS